jgi:inositol transport system substrate-binding protein
MARPLSSNVGDPRKRSLLGASLPPTSRAGVSHVSSHGVEPSMNRPLIRLLLPDAYNPHEQFQAEQARLAAGRLEASLDVDFARAEFSLQVRQVLRAAFQGRERPDAIVVMPVQDAAFRALSEMVVRSGIGWICLNRDPGNLTELRQAYPKVPVSFIAPDQREIGRMHARQLRTLFPQSAKILYVLGSASTSSAQERQLGLKEGLALRGPAIEIAGTVEGNWTAKEARAAVGTWLRERVSADGPRLDAIVCQSDFMAIGAIEAMKTVAQELEVPFLAELAVVGCDGLSSVGKRLVDEGKLAATVVAPTTADKAVEAVVAWSRSGVPVPERLLLRSQEYPDQSVLEPRNDAAR